MSVQSTLNSLTYYTVHTVHTHTGHTKLTTKYWVYITCVSKSNFEKNTKKKINNNGYIQRKNKNLNRYNEQLESQLNPDWKKKKKIIIP